MVGPGTTGRVATLRKMDAVTFSVDVSVWRGWCTLELTDEEAGAVSVQTHWTGNALVDLVDSIHDIVFSQRSSSSCRWPLELAGGHFLDFVLDPHDGVNIAVHETAYGSGQTTVATIWSAARGKVVFSTRVSVSDFASGFSSAFRRLRLNSVDSHGVISEWEHTFPFTRVESLEIQTEKRFGHRPENAESRNASPEATALNH